MFVLIKTNNLKNLLLLLVLLLGVISVYAQDGKCKEVEFELQNLQNKFSRLDVKLVQSKMDSLESLIPMDCEIATMISHIITGRIQKESGRHELALQNFQRGNEIAAKHNKTLFQKHILTLSSVLAAEQDNFEEYAILMDSAFQVPCHEDSIRCLKQNIKIKINNAVHQRRTNKYQESISTYIEAKKLYEAYDLKDSIYLVSILNGLGNIYDDELGDNKLAIDYYKKALENCPHNHNSRFSLYNNIGNQYTSNNQLDSSAYYLNKTLNQTDNPRFLITPNQGLGDIELKRGNIKKAITYYKQAISYAEAINNNRYLYYSNSLLAKAYYLDGKYQKAKSLLTNVVNYYKTTEIENSQINEIKKYLYLAKIAVLDPSLSREYYDLLATRDSIRGDRRIEMLNKSVTRYETIILQDSLKREVLLKENLNIKASNYRLALFSALLFLLVAAFLLRKIYNSFISTKRKNENLIFKNIELEDINNSLQQKIQRLNTARRPDTVNQTLQFKSLNKTFNIQFAEIQYISAEDNGVRIYTPNNSYWSDLSLKAIKSKIPEESFIQVYRSTIVNLQHLEWVNHSSLKIENGAELKIGRSFKEKIREILDS